MTFTMKEYRLEFTIWAAYRAAQAGSAKATGKEFSAALKQCGIVDYIDGCNYSDITEEDFNTLHLKWCGSIIKHIKKEYNKGISYGIAAKLIGVFLKGYYILAGNEETPLARVIHPPIDSFLLKGIDAKKGTRLDKEYKWTKLEEDCYFELLAKLKDIEKNEPLWKIEKYWELG